MNPSTGEIMKLGPKQKPPIDWIEILIGEVVEIKGVKCKVVNIHPGKHRIVLETIDTAISRKSEKK